MRGLMALLLVLAGCADLCDLDCQAQKVAVVYGPHTIGADCALDFRAVPEGTTIWRARQLVAAGGGGTVCIPTGTQLRVGTKDE